MSNEMNEEPRNAIIVDALQHYRVANAALLHGVWERVHDECFADRHSTKSLPIGSRLPGRKFFPKPRRGSYWRRRSIVWSGAIAATLLVGLGIGVLVDRARQLQTDPGLASTTKLVRQRPVSPRSSLSLPSSERNAVAYSFANAVRGDPVTETSLAEFLTGSSELVAALMERTSDENSRSALAAKASMLLTETHMLLDAPAAENLQLRAMLKDLELFLTRVQLGETTSQYAQRANSQHRLLARISQAKAATETLE